MEQIFRVFRDGGADATQIPFNFALSKFTENDRDGMAMDILTSYFFQPSVISFHDSFLSFPFFLFLLSFPSLFSSSLFLSFLSLLSFLSFPFSPFLTLLSLFLYFFSFPFFLSFFPFFFFTNLSLI
jgi:hypothetical protein